MPPFVIVAVVGTRFFWSQGFLFESPGGEKRPHPKNRTEKKQRAYLAQPKADWVKLGRPWL